MKRWWRAVLIIPLLGCKAAAPPQEPGQGLEPQDIAGRQLFLPAGFRINLFSDDVDGARAMALGPNGAVYVSRQGAGRIVRLADGDGDGVAESADAVLTGLNQPYGIAFRGDTMYFAEVTAVKRLDPGATTPVGLIDNLPSGGHSTRTIAFGPDDRMYVSVGSSCNLCPDIQPLRAAIFQYALDGTNGRPFATGLRNSVGLAVHPTTGELWATNNDRDNLGDDIPPERINIIKDGAWYGWPSCYLPGEPNPDAPEPRRNCAEVEPPAITFQAHSAPLGIRFYTGTAFPDAYRGDAFMAYHGSWNRSVPTGAKVVRVQVENGKPVSIDDFVVGWQLSDGSRWGRPVDVLEAVDGSLLISDDHGGRIWRVSYEP
jgi:glucose/arabinose dehydrogenase